MSKHKYLLKFFSIACVLFLGIFYYRHQQSLSLNAQLELPQGSNLKVSTTTSIYHNNKYGYSFTYPSHLFVEENAGKFGYVPADENADIISFFSDGSPAFTQNLSIWPQNNISLPEGLLEYVKTTERYQDGYLEAYSAPYIDIPKQKVLKLEEINLDGKKAVILISKILPNQGSSEETFFKAWIEYQPGKLLYLVDEMLNYHPVTFDEEILTSFVFTKSNPSPIWPEYKFTKLGFAFRAPPDWLVYPSDRTAATIYIDNQGYLNAPSFLLGPVDTILNLDPKNSDNSPQIGNLKTVIKGYIGYNSMLNVRSYIDWVDGKQASESSEAQFATISPLVDSDKRRAFIGSDSNYFTSKEVFIELNDKYGLTLFIEDKSVEVIFYRILRSFRFLN